MLDPAIRELASNGKHRGSVSITLPEIEPWRAGPRHFDARHIDAPTVCHAGTQGSSPTQRECVIVGVVPDRQRTRGL